MKIAVAGYVDVARRAAELGCRAPTGVALLPANFSTASTAEELVWCEDAPAIRAAWQEAGIAETPVEPEDSRPRPFQGAFADRPLGPVVFFGTAVFRNEARSVGVALAALACALADHRATPTGTVKVEAVVHRRGGDGCSCLSYEGDPYELVALSRMLREIWDTGELNYSGVENSRQAGVRDGNSH